jgi:hypothetical protein
VSGAPSRDWHPLARAHMSAQTMRQSLIKRALIGEG